MKKYFYIILIEVKWSPKGKSITVSCDGVIEIEAKEDKASLIFDKILKKSMLEWKHLNVIYRKVIFFNFWEEKEIPLAFIDIPIEDWDISAGLMSELKKLLVRSYKDINNFGGDVIPLHLKKKNIVELKSFLKTNGAELPK